ncbi:hypothetical protein EJ110_NYTH07731 [Nymphaea thermarum]|nr:hypothetical protein EJ110_NYTH07731 [Nymphaea thermarum]
MGWIHHSSHLHALQLIPSGHTHPQTRCCQLTAATGRPDPVYGCRPCNFYIHKTCADLPAYLRHPSHPSHTLILAPTPPCLQGTAQCDGCWKQVNGFSYHCTNCSFDLHAHCAFLPPTVNQPSTNAAGQDPNAVSSMPPAIWPGQAVAPWPMNGQPEPTAACGQPLNPLSSLTPAVWPGQAGAPGHASSGIDPIHGQGGGVLQSTGSGHYPSQADHLRLMRNAAAAIAAIQANSAQACLNLIG